MSTFLLILRLLVALAFVGGLLWFLARSGRKGRLSFLLGGGTERMDLEVSSQRALGKNTSVALVRSGERTLLVGVSEHGVQLLAEGDDLVSAATHRARAEREAQLEAAAIAANRPEDPAHLNDTGQAAPKRLLATRSPNHSWMTLLQSLRELTVRKS